MILCIKQLVREGKYVETAMPVVRGAVAAFYTFQVFATLRKGADFQMPDM